MKNTLKYFIPDMIEILWMTLLGLSVALLFLDSHRQSERIKDLEVIVNAQQLLDNLEQPLYAEPK